MTVDVDLRDDVDLVDLDELYPYSNNPKEHPARQLDKIEAQIREFGWDVPIVADANLERGEIVKGHGRFLVARDRLDLDRVPVIWQEYESEADKRAERIGDNRSAESDWDDEMLSVELDRLLEDDYDLALTALDEDEIDDLLELQEPPDLVDDEEPDVENDQRVVIVAETEAEAQEIGDWAEANGYEWHVVDQ
ncbi:MAG: ParB/Srx family N-terminal domain-containing protein [Halobacteria archaeon]|nr:ParB/Srx family N-terminal domain-containing protein [Halobacteria archaeon]